MKKKILSSLTALFLLNGCVSLNSVSLTQIPQQRKEQISAQVSKTIFLGFNFDNDYVDELTNKLMAKCPGGQIKGVLTKDQTTAYLIVFKKEIIATAYCIRS